MLGLQECERVTLILIFWVAIWLTYNFAIRPQFKNPLLDDPLTRFKIELPDALKCAIPHVSRRPENNDCTKENIDGWTLGHVAIYYTIGLYVQDIDYIVLLISIICEIWEYAVGWRARWLLDPLTNWTAYRMGVWHSKTFHPTFPLSTPGKIGSTLAYIVVLVAILQLNHPSLMKYKQVV